MKETYAEDGDVLELHVGDGDARFDDEERLAVMMESLAEFMEKRWR